MSGLTAREYIELQHMIQQWTVPIRMKDISYINREFRRKNRIWEYFLSQYTSRLLPHISDLGIDTGQEHSEELLMSGLFCFVGQCLQYYSQFGLNNNLHDSPECVIEYIMDIAIDFVLLYLHVDHYLDDIKVDITNKIATIDQMLILIYDPDKISTLSLSGMNNLVSSYKRLLNINPNAKSALIDLFKTEASSIMFQRNSNASREEYLKMAEIKGGKTCIAIQALFNADIKNGAYELGACVQLLDDMLDVYNDQRQNIHTIATYDLKHNNSLDRLCLYTARKIYSLNSIYTIFKVLMYEILTYIVTRHTCFSKRLKRRLLPYTHIHHFDETTLRTLITEWMMDSFKEDQED